MMKSTFFIGRNVLPLRLVSVYEKPELLRMQTSYKTYGIQILATYKLSSRLEATVC